MRKALQIKSKPKILPKSLDQYFARKISENAVQFKENFEKANYIPASEMVQARRDIACLDNKVVAARQEWGTQKKDWDERWKACSEKNAELYESIPKFCEYYKDLTHKKEEFLQFRNREQEQCNQKDHEISRLKKELARLEQIKEISDRRQAKFTMFRTYMEKVVKAHPSVFADFKSIVERYVGLNDDRSALLQSGELASELIVYREATLKDELIGKANEVLSYSNYLTELSAYKTTLEGDTEALERKLQYIKTTAAKRSMVVGQIRAAVDHLYKEVCREFGHDPKITEEDVLGQLTDIGISMTEMYKLGKDIQRMLKAAFITAEQEKAMRDKALKRQEERQKRLDKFIIKADTDMRKMFGFAPISDSGTDEVVSSLFSQSIPRDQELNFGLDLLRPSTITLPDADQVKKQSSFL